jgi:hypothetical protein
MLGIPAYVAHFHGSYELTGNLAPLLKIGAVVLQLTVISGLGLIALRQGKQFNRQSAYRFSLLTMAAAVILSNVLSPQYFVWALPIIVLLAIEALPEANPRFALAFVLIIGTAVATTWLFPYHYFSTDAHPAGLIPTRLADGGLSVVGGAISATVPARISPIATIVLTVRNLAYLALAIWLGIATLPARRPRLASSSTLEPASRKSVAAPLSPSYSGI